MVTAHSSLAPQQPAVADPDGSQFARLLAAREVRAAFQPLVDLRTGQVVGLEALARGPVGTPYSSPAALFGTARAQGRLAELDWVCRAEAFRTALAADLPGSLSIFVNIEAESLTTPCPPDLVDVLTQAESSLRVFVELNDRALAADPAALLAAVDRAREMGWGIAIDDVGASRGCLAVLPMVHADVVKLDLRLLAEASPQHVSSVVTSVLRHVESTGASLVAEGIETEADIRLARALGATYGQGHHVALPGPLEARYPTPRSVVPVVGRAAEDVPAVSPYRMLPVGQRQRMDGHLLDRMIQLVVQQCRSVGSPPLVLASLGAAGQVPAEQLAMLTGLAGQALLLVVFGVGMPAEPAPGVRGVRLDPHDPMARERFVITLTEQSATALIARSSDSSPGLFDVALTQEQQTVHGAARQLIRRIPSPGEDNQALSAPRGSSIGVGGADLPGHPDAGADRPHEGRRWLSRRPARAAQHAAPGR